MANEKTGLVGKVLKTVSFKAGVLCRKASQVGKVTENKSWKAVAEETKDIVQNVEKKTEVVLKKAGQTVKANLDGIKESFEEGMKSLSHEIKDAAATEKHPSASEPKAEKVVPKKAPARKAKSKDKADGAAKKVKSKKAVKKPVKKESVEPKPSNADMEKEIDKITAGIGEV